jgi:hypothetical protein
MKVSTWTWTFCTKKKDNAQITWVAYQGRTARYLNKTVDPRKFQVGDWVLKKVSLMTKEATKGKLALKWEGPYQVVKWHEKGAYHLKSEI